MSDQPLALILDGAAEGEVLVRVHGYRGGRIDATARRTLHRGLDDAIRFANAVAEGYGVARPARDKDTHSSPR